MAKITDKLRDRRNELIKTLNSQELTVEELAAIFNLTRQAVYNILNKENGK